MKAGWEVKTLGDVCRLLNGRAYKKPELLSHGKYPVLRVGNFFTNNNWYFSDLELPEDKYCDNGDLLYAWSASFGPRVWEGGKVIYHYHIWKVEPKAQQIDKRYLYYFFDWDKERIKNEQGAGTTMIHVSKTSMDARKIPLPPLEEQKRIVSILDEAFEGLDRARENAEANLKSARELFTASSKKLILNDPIQPSVSTSKDNIIDLTNEIERKKKDKKFRGPLVLGADRFPEIPNGWFWSSPEQLSNNIVDCLHKTPQWSDSGKLCLRTTNFKPNFLDLTSARYVSDETYAKRIVRLEPKQGDVLYSREGGILGIACEFPSGLEACLGQRMMMFRLRREWILPTYFCWVMNSDFILKEVKRLTGGAAAPHLNIGDIRRFPIPVPPMAIQHQIVKELGQFQQSHNQLLKKLRTKLQDISDLRQSLLQRAFAGELT